MDLDDLLAASAPPVADRTPELREALRLTAAAAESQARPRRRARRAGLVAGVTAAIVAVGAAASASGFVTDWVPWTTPEGSNCTLKFGAKPISIPGEPLTYEYGQPLEDGPAELRLAVNEANRFLAAFDLDSIDEASAIREFQQQEDAVIASVPPAEAQPRAAGDDLAVQAVALHVSRELDAHLASLGLGQAEHVSLGIAMECE